MPKAVLLLASFSLLISTLPSSAQDVGGKFGSRAPRTCASRTGALTAETARQYFVCDPEFIEGPNASGKLIDLVSDVTVQ